jgi:hypothetical protein
MKLIQNIEESISKKHIVTMSFELINYRKEEKSEIKLIHETLREYNIKQIVNYEILNVEEIGIEENESIKKLKKAVNHCFSDLYFTQKNTGEIDNIINFLQIQDKWKKEKMKLIMSDDSDSEKIIDGIFELDAIMKNDDLLNKKIPKTGSTPFQFPPIYDEEYGSKATSVKLELSNLYLMDELPLNLNVVLEDENRLVFEGKEDRTFKVVEYQILLAKILKIPQESRMTLKIEVNGHYELEEGTNLIKNGILNLMVDVEECINMKYRFELKEIV